MSWVSRLQDIDAALTEAGRCLWDELGHADDVGDVEAYARTLHKLDRVGMLRGEVARQLRLTRAQGQVQVLALPDATPQQEPPGGDE